MPVTRHTFHPHGLCCPQPSACWQVACNTAHAYIWGCVALTQCLLASCQQYSTYTSRGLVPNVHAGKLPAIQHIHVCVVVHRLHGAHCHVCCTAHTFLNPSAFNTDEFHRLHVANTLCRLVVYYQCHKQCLRGQMPYCRHTIQKSCL